MKLRRYLTLTLLFASFGVALALVKSNEIHHFLKDTNPYPFQFFHQEFTLEISDVRDAVDPQGATHARLLKLSFPFSAAKGGCEFTYGAAVYSFRELPQRTTFFELNSPRYLLKFKYDNKNERCESKDLAVDLKDIPDTITIQLIDVEVDEETVAEKTRRAGFKVFLNDTIDKFEPRVEVSSIEPQYPFLSDRKTIRNALFSTNAKHSVILTPHQSLKGAILSAFEQRIDKCVNLKVCDTIRIAVSRIDDPDILNRIEYAQKIGLVVESIVSPHARKRGELSRSGIGFLTTHYSPWMWLRGNPMITPDDALLPMHAKFIIFGDDLVISSNTSYGFDWFYRTRELAIKYEGREAASIFQEIFTMIRTSVFYPVEVDLRDSVIILMNAERMRGYSASSRRSFVEVRTNEGVHSSAYGILFSLLQRTPGKVDFAMAPLVEGCAAYTRRLCLFDLLAERAQRKELSLRLNSFFYLDKSLEDGKTGKLFWNTETLKNSLALKQSFYDFKQKVSPDGNAIQLMIMPQESTSNHHQRMVLVGDQIVIGGSANFAKRSTLNTIEVLRDPELNKYLRREIKSYDDPYIVIDRESQSSDRPHFQRCEFILEREVFKAKIADARSFDSREILQSFQKSYPQFSELEDLKVVLPENIESMFETPDQFLAPSFTLVELRGEIMSRASSFCLFSPSTNTTFPVQLRN